MIANDLDDPAVKIGPAAADRNYYTRACGGHTILCWESGEMPNLMRHYLA